MPSQKFVVYLAGPITGCNPAQVRHWRDQVKKKYERQCEFLDPVEHLVSDRAIPHEVVAADIHAIENAEGILVNMWRESIGTAMSVVHAHRTRCPVIVSDPNRLGNRALTFYADGVEDSPLKGMKTLLTLLRAESWHVMRKGGEEERFSRGVLITSIENACRLAGCDDIVIPRLALPRIIDGLRATKRKMPGRQKRNMVVSTSDITAVIESVLTELERDPRYGGMTLNISDSWKRSQEGMGSPTASESARQRSQRRVQVPVHSPKSHGTIWGRTVNEIGDITSAAAREVLYVISASASGITRIVLGTMEKARKRKTCQARIVASDEPFVIEGELFDNGRKGGKQRFQVRVQFDDEKGEIAKVIETHLRHEGLWAAAK